MAYGIVGGTPNTKSQEEIDIMGADTDAALFAECKWTSEMNNVTLVTYEEMLKV